MVQVITGRCKTEHWAQHDARRSRREHKWVQGAQVCGCNGYKRVKEAQRGAREHLRMQ